MQNETKKQRCGKPTSKQTSLQKNTQIKKKNLRKNLNKSASKADFLRFREEASNEGDLNEVSNIDEISLSDLMFDKNTGTTDSKILTDVTEERNTIPCHASAERKIFPNRKPKGEENFDHISEKAKKYLETNIDSLKTQQKTKKNNRTATKPFVITSTSNPSITNHKQSSKRRINKRCNGIKKTITPVVLLFITILSIYFGILKDPYKILQWLGLSSSSEYEQIRPVVHNETGKCCVVKFLKKTTYVYEYL